MMAFYTRAETCSSKILQRLKTPEIDWCYPCFYVSILERDVLLKEEYIFSCNCCPTSQEISTIYENWYFVTIRKVTLTELHPMPDEAF